MSPLIRTFWIGTGLILLSNALALGGVYYNRSGEPDSVMRLSERELAKSYNQVVDSSDFAAQVLRLEYRVAEGWVTLDKLRALGFEMDEQRAGYRNPRLERDGLVVLELDGAYYQRQLAEAQASLEQAQKAYANEADSAVLKEQVDSADYELRRLRRNDSRLYVVDAGLDAAELRQRYPDRQRYSLARASLRAGLRWVPGEARTEDYTLYAELAELSVPSRWSQVFATWQPYDRDAEERSKVSVELAFGKRFEPWVIAASKVE
ncbi:MAG: DUF4824 family protein [Pseudomonas sp.]